MNTDGRVRYLVVLVGQNTCTIFSQIATFGEISQFSDCKIEMIRFITINSPTTPLLALSRGGGLFSGELSHFPV